MTIDRNDPRWTAYVLDEMDPFERATFEKEIEAFSEADEILDEIRETVGLLETGLRPAPVQLTEAQRIRVENAVPSTRSISYTRLTFVAGIAALVMVGFISISVPSLLRTRSDAPETRTPLVAEAIDTTRPAGQSTFSDPDSDPEETSPQAETVGETQQDSSIASPAPAPQPEPDDVIAENEAPRGATAAAVQEELELFGRVTDATGALIPGVEVTLRPVDGPEVLAITGNSGEYRFTNLPDGEIGLSASLPGFLTASRRFELVEDTSRDFALEVAAVATAVEVVSDADALLATTGSSVAGALTAVRSNAFAAAAPPPPAPPPPPTQADWRAAFGVGGQTVNQVAENTVENLIDRVNDRRERLNTEEYGRINDNPFYLVSEEPLATFSVDVDTASYANVRRFLTQRTLPPPDAVRIEEMVNYFTYDYPAPQDGQPVRINTEVASSPWNPEHRLVQIGIQGQRIRRDERAASNLVFLIDVSGSMDSPDKLPLLKDGMKLLVEQLGENDRVSMVVYAGASGLALDSTPGDQTQRLLRALDRLSAGGSTNGGAGIELAYNTAVANFIEGGVNRVILATDGDFNIGATNNTELTRLIEEKAETGVFLSVLGFGTGNLNDAGMEALADQGNGNYAYIDSIREARKVLVEEIGSTLVTIAKDVKFQVEFNPAEVGAYRLIGYENRLLENQDFNDDTRDAGEIGAGHTVTALFEIVPNGVELNVPGVDPLRYQTPLATTEQVGNGELLTVKVRYKEPDADVSLLIEARVRDRETDFADASNDYRFASAVASFGMILRNSPYKGDSTYDTVLAIADQSLGADSEGYRDEFVSLVRRARAIQNLDAND
jgi:Ca-activated chloride channel family protein